LSAPLSPLPGTRQSRYWALRTVHAMMAARRGWDACRSMARRCVAKAMASSVEPLTANRMMSNASSWAQNVSTLALVVFTALLGDSRRVAASACRVRLSTTRSRRDLAAGRTASGTFGKCPRRMRGSSPAEADPFAFAVVKRNSLATGRAWFVRGERSVRWRALCTIGRRTSPNRASLPAPHEATGAAGGITARPALGSSAPP